MEDRNLVASARKPVLAELDLVDPITKKLLNSTVE
jgi:hypothetical protein